LYAPYLREQDTADKQFGDAKYRLKFDPCNVSLGHVTQRMRIPNKGL